MFRAFAVDTALIPVVAGVIWPLTGTLLLPMFAVGAMALSSGVVLSNALCLRWIGRGKVSASTPRETNLRTTFATGKTTTGDMR